MVARYKMLTGSLRNEERSHGSVELETRPERTEKRLTET